MAATIAAARACARTLLLECLRIDAFHGAIPHVMLVVDRSPCVQQKVLVEGYRQTLDELNGTLAPDAESRASQGLLYIPLDPNATAPTGANGLPPPHDAAAHKPRISYTIAAFQAGSFMRDMHRLQAFLRRCGEGKQGDGDATTTTTTTTTAAAASPSTADFEDRFREVSQYLLPLPRADAQAAAGHADEYDTQAFAESLRTGSKRELLGFILIQRNAFQNELKQYRLRLALFNMGMRVAEHCHLESMSVSADALAAAGRFRAAVEDDQVYTYARSCAFPPSVTESLAKAIADSIDLHAWRRQQEGATTDANDASSLAAPPPPPPAYTTCMANSAVWALLHRGALSWAGGSSTASLSPAAFDAAMRQPITGVGAPLRIVSKGSEGHEEQVLTFAGGLEDCLMNTGHYIAAHQQERNSVDAHRRRFPAAVASPDDDDGAAEHDGDKKKGSGKDGDNGAGDASGGEGQSRGHEQEDAPAHGRRLKKKEYLALLRAQGEKPNKPLTAKKGHSAAAAAGDSDADEQLENTRARASGGAQQDAAEGRCSRDSSSSKGEEGKAISVSIGGTFPIGEVISESFDLSKLSGVCSVFAYPGLSKEVTMSEPRPFTMTIDQGCVTEVSDDCPAEFADLLSLVRQAEGGKCYVRELGIGLNPFVGPQHVLTDVTSFERQWGIHLSLGLRHPLFVKQKARRNPDGSVCAAVKVDGPVPKRKAGKYHIDVFVDAARLEMGPFAMDFTKGVAVL